MSLTPEEQEYLDDCLTQKRGRRAVDANIRNVADWREFLLTAASNLECGQPQAQPGIAKELRELGDLLVREAMARADGSDVRLRLRLILLPMIQRREDVMLLRAINRVLATPPPPEPR